jgi:hypothetical protein
MLESKINPIALMLELGKELHYQECLLEEERLVNKTEEN